MVARARWFGMALAPWFAGCGYVGDPLPPALHIPVAISDLRAFQRSDKIHIEFTAPEMTTEGLLLPRLGEVDLRAGAVEAQPFRLETWEPGATRLDVPAPRPGPAHFEVPAGGWVGREVVIAVRVSSHKGRWSEWSKPVRLSVVAPLPAPAALTAEAVPEGVRLSWQIADDRPKLAFRIHRRSSDQEHATVVARVEGRQWVDSGTRYGQTYVYSLQSLLKAGENEAESEFSHPVTVTPVDRFPPAVPGGLTAVAGFGSIELAWDRSQEQDFAGYFLYRLQDGGELIRIAGPLERPAYSDRDITAGTRYSYSVSSVDEQGNESAPCAPVQTTAPQELKEKND